VLTIFGIGLLIALGGQAARAGATSGAPVASSSDSSSSSESSSASANSSSACPASVQFSSVSIALQGSTVVVTVQHTGLECPDATASTLHAHQNLLSSPHAGSDANHQWNQDYLIGPGTGTTIEFPLLAAADGKCFVQVDVHAGTIRTGKFYPTSTCESTSPSSSTSASSSTSPPESSSAPASSSAPESSSAAPSSSSASSSIQPTSTTSVPTASSSIAPIVIGQTSSPSGLASTGVRAGVPAALALLLIGSGLALTRGARRRRH